MHRGILTGLFGLLVGGFGVWMAQPNPPPAPPPAPTPTPAPGDPDGVYGSLFRAHNHERGQKGIPALKVNQQLMTAANKHASWMAASGELSHTGAHGSSFAHRIQAEGYKFWRGGENIAAGYRDVNSVMAGWMRSPGHRANILNREVSEVGFGVVTSSAPGTEKTWWCAVFAAPWTGGGTPLIVVEEQPDGITGD